MQRVAGSGLDTAIAKLGFKNGHIVLEVGYGDDVDDEVRIAVEDAIDADLEDEDYEDLVDAALLWWRDGDGDLTDMLVDLVSALGPTGFIVLMSPKVGNEGEVDPIDVAEAATTAGMNASASTNVTTEWSATRLVAPKSGSWR